MSGNRYAALRAGRRRGTTLKSILVISRHLPMNNWKAWFSYGSERIGQGRENAKAWLREHPDAVSRIRNTILTKRGLLTAPVEDNGEVEPAPEAAKAKR